MPAFGHCAGAMDVPQPCPSTGPSRHLPRGWRNPRAGRIRLPGRGRSTAMIGSDAGGARREHHDPVGEHDRLGDGMGDEGSWCRALPRSGQILCAPLARQLVDRTEGLVEQKELGFGHEGTGDRRPLAHAAGQGAGTGIGEAVEADEGDELVHGLRVGRFRREVEARSMLPRTLRHGSREGPGGHGETGAAHGLGGADHRWRSRRKSAPRGPRSSAGWWTCRSPDGPTSAVVRPGANVMSSGATADASRKVLASAGTRSRAAGRAAHRIRRHGPLRGSNGPRDRG